MVTKKCVDTNKNVTIMSMIKKGVYYKCKVIFDFFIANLSFEYVYMNEKNAIFLHMIFATLEPLPCFEVWEEPL